ncbi:FAD-dependent oxidoreductase [Nocardiopsis potens]|uniref:FAD-dependent oxidoreductase n=1 Tax=Nocardiopsis potens TaxID=1246458 RepID=UPI0003450F78|nr:FAD-dependent oxidoreductase [Nocardiopsis potens]
MQGITVVGGGIAGLAAAIEAAEGGARVTLHEAHAEPGGRGRAIGGPYTAHEGPHVFYADGPHWTWLKERGLTGRLVLPPLRAGLHAGFRHRGRFTRIPPAGFLRMSADRNRTAPVDEDFRTWAGRHYGEQAAEAAANAVGVVTYVADTGRLSAAYVWNLFGRIFGPRVPAVRWTAGGWQAVVDRMVRHARDLGVRIETGSRVTEPPEAPVIVATELSSARTLLGDASLEWESGYCVLLDIAVRPGRRDSFVMFDLDEGGFHESYSMQDPTVSPAGESLFQLDMPVREGEGHAEAHARLRRLAETALPGWEERTAWQRTGTARGRTGALDLPGTTWRDRPAIARGDGVFLAGDMVAAPGMRGEISLNSGVAAARAALHELGLSDAPGPAARFGARPLRR